jgi:hypothetical protein
MLTVGEVELTKKEYPEQARNRVASTVKRWRESLGDDGESMSYERFSDWLGLPLEGHPLKSLLVPSYAVLFNWDHGVNLPNLNKYQALIEASGGHPQERFWREIQEALKE